MKFKSKTYDRLKWIVWVVMPAIITFYGTVGATFTIPYTEQIMTIASAFQLCLGACLGISNYNFNKEMK